MCALDKMVYGIWHNYDWSNCALMVGDCMIKNFKIDMVVLTLHCSLEVCYCVYVSYC